MYATFRKQKYKMLSSCSNVEGKWYVQQACIFNGKGRIMGKETCIGFYPSPGFFEGTSYIEARHPDAVVEIGSSYINNGFDCEAEHGRISIGDNCLIGANVCILNSDFHSCSIERRHVGGAE